MGEWRGFGMRGRWLVCTLLVLEGSGVRSGVLRWKCSKLELGLLGVFSRLFLNFDVGAKQTSLSLLDKPRLDFVKN